MTATAYRHIELDSTGVAWIAGRNTKVVEIAAERIAYEWNAEQIHAQHEHLTMAEIHSALAYYFDHKAEMERDITERLARADQIISSLGESSVRAKLQRARLSP